MFVSVTAIAAGRFDVGKIAEIEAGNSFEGVVQIRGKPKTRNPFAIEALSISGVTLKGHFFNHAEIPELAAPSVPDNTQKQEY